MYSFIHIESNELLSSNCMGLYSPAIKKFNSAAWRGKEKENKHKQTNKRQQQNKKTTHKDNQPTKKNVKQFWGSLSMMPNSHSKDKSTFLFWSQNWISGISFLNRILIDSILVVLSYFIMFVLNQIPPST